MKKRKELDALAPPHAVSRRSSGKRSSQELLTDSSDDRSEYWNISTRSGSKCRGRRNRACPGFLKACSAFLACASVLATASLIWLFIDVRQQLTALRTELDQVIAGSEGVPDALQKCHSLSRDLQNNQTIIFTQITDLKLQLTNFTNQLTGIQHGLHKVQEWFQAAPELANVPTNLHALSNSVASFGSKIEDLSATVKILKATNARVQDAQTIIQQNITSIKSSLTELTNVTQKPEMLTTNETKIKTDELNAAIIDLANNLTRADETLSKKIEWVSKDQKKDHHTLVLLKDTAQNISMKVMSLEMECAKLSEQAAISASVQKLSEQANDARITESNLSQKVKQLEQLYNTLRNSTSTMFATRSEIQNSPGIDKEKSQIAESLNLDVTTEQDHSALGEFRPPNL